ncbi:TPA: lysis system i-spanin subunit Rz [Enterobacter roggenkampii]
MNISTMFQPGWKCCGIALLCGALLGALAGWWVTDNKFTADIATLKQQHAEDLKAISDEASAVRDKNAALEHAFSSAVAKSDQKHTQELNDALAENKALRDAVTSGSRQLQFAKAGLATCNLSKSAAASASGMDNAAAVELSAEAGRNIYDIRAGIISDQQKLKALQDYIRAGQEAGVIAK